MNPRTRSSWSIRLFLVMCLPFAICGLGGCGDDGGGGGTNDPFTCVDEAQGAVCYHYTGAYYENVDPADFCADITYRDGAVCDTADAWGYCDLAVDGVTGSEFRMYIYPAYGDETVAETACGDLDGTWTAL